tara:strand:+ start:640 stop:837 length:198 start_codon:yes stop_codon:yes gene_type:complete
MSKVTKLDDRRCSICDGHIEPLRNAKGDIVWEDGHNAQPINNGRCCNDCNMSVVLIARMEAMGLS